MANDCRRAWLVCRGGSFADELQIRFGQKVVTARIDQLRENVRKEQTAEMYTILNEEKLDKVDPSFVDDEA